MKVQHTGEKQIYFQEPDFKALESPTDIQHELIKHMESQGHKNLYHISIFIDGFTDLEFRECANTLNNINQS